MRYRDTRRPEFVSKGEMWAVLDRTETRLSAVMGQWSDDIPTKVRAEIRRIHAPILNLLLKTGKR